MIFIKVVLAAFICLTRIRCDGLHVPTRDDKDITVLKNFIKTADEDETDLDKLPENGEVFEGDILMDDRLRKAVRGQNTKKSIQLRASDSFKWPNGIIYYVFDRTFSSKAQRLLKETIRQYEMRTCIRFRKRRQEKDFIVFSSKQKGCASYVGRIGGPQVINLERHCSVVGTYEHEIMHALGFIHEHSRPDRDDYIKIHYPNIERGLWNMFQKYRFTDDLNEEFNYASVMLYRNDAFTRNGKPTIEAVGEPDLRFGQRVRFSIGDIKQINILYDCKRYLRHPFYAGLFGDYHGNAARRDIVESRKQLTDTIMKSWQKLMNFDPR